MLTLKPLPYKPDVLEPILSMREVHVHYNMHQKAYVDKANELITGTGFQHSTLEDMILNGPKDLKEQAGQIYNHEMYWKSLCPRSKSVFDDESELGKAVIDQYGSELDFCNQFKEAIEHVFGSGWVYLVSLKKQLAIQPYHNGDTPVGESCTPLLCVDAWEHAWLYDPKYAADKKKYANNILLILNWAGAESRF